MGLIWEKNDLPSLAEKKVQMASDACRERIYAGVDVDVVGGREHFSLELHDQTNIDSLFNAITLGAKECQYHSDGNPMKIYPAADIVALYTAYRTLVDTQTAYCNFLKVWIKREPDNEVLGNIVYGSNLPADLDAKLKELLITSGAQLKHVIAAVNDGAFVDKMDSLETQVTDAQMALCDVYEQIVTAQKGV